MQGHDLIAISLGLSIGVGFLAWGVAQAIQRISPDPFLADRAWGAAVFLPLLAPAAVASLLLIPAPTRVVTTMPTVAAPFMSGAPVPEVVTEAPFLFPSSAQVFLALATAVMAWRLILLAWRTARLVRVIARATPVCGPIATMVEAQARARRLRPPVVLISDEVSEAMLSGLGRTKLILPATATEDPLALRVMISHEMAHLRRGDHRILWVEELAAAALAFSPMTPFLRSGRDAARERACDAEALSCAGPEARLDYARTLIGALKRRSAVTPSALPAPNFTGMRRKTAMHRLDAILNPAPPASRRLHILSAAGCATLLMGLGAVSYAVAGQRAPTYRLVTASAVEVAAAVDGMPETVIQAPTLQESAAVAMTPALPNTPQVLDPVRAVKQDPPPGSAPASQRDLPPELVAHYRSLSAEGYQQACVSENPTDVGFCAGVMFSYLHRARDNGVCAAEAVISGRGDAASLAAYVEGGKSQVARLGPAAGESVHDFAGRALRAAYPCEA